MLSKGNGDDKWKYKCRQVDTLAVRGGVWKLWDNVKPAKHLGAEAYWKNQGQMEIAVMPEPKQMVAVSPGIGGWIYLSLCHLRSILLCDEQVNYCV